MTRVDLLGGIYGQITQARRAWYRERPERRRRLRQPVVSVGNLVAGGSGKTPAVAALARLLLARGERPAVLSRGYGRRDRRDGVVVVSDGERVLEPVTRSGDEPQLLARTLRGVPVLVCGDRYLAGALAERTFGVSVILLDDGFQHVQLERDVDLLMVSTADLEERLLPTGRLREPLAAARFADAILVTGSDDEVSAVARTCGHESGFRVVSTYGAPWCDGGNEPPPHGRVVAVAGIARPARFFDALRQRGWDVAKDVAFRDHHWFTTRDLEAIARTAREVDAEAIVTTEKDAVRLPPRPPGLPVWVLPMDVEIEPSGVFEAWLLDRLARARTARVGARA